MNVVDLDSRRPHDVCEMECPCGRKWIAVCLASAEELECPGCGEMVNRRDYRQKGSTVSEQKPSIGRIVHYRLSAQDAEAIARRRTSGVSIAGRIKEEKWPLGAQAHIGNPVAEGQTLPLVICRVWPDEYGPGVHGVNGQVLLDGNDQLWVTSAREGEGPGTWSWPPRV